MTSNAHLPALDLCAIGLGQGGGNLAAEWHRRGYRTLLFNTARADFQALSHHEGLEMEERLRIHIGLGGTDGAGKDPEYGAQCLKAHEDEVRAAVEAQLAGADAILVCSGLGGGTGSAAHELIRILEPLEYPVISVASLPADAESGITKVNAVKTANALVQAPLHGRVFIDNERLVEAFPDVDILSYYPHVNARVLGPLDRINRLNNDPALWSVRSFDGEDLRKVLLSGGVLQTHIARLKPDEPLSPGVLVDVVEACVAGGHHLAPGLTLAECAYLSIVVVGPERVLKQTPIQVFDDTIAELKAETGGGAVYEGIYAGGDEVPLSVYVLGASLALPPRVQQLLGAAHDEGGALMKKISEEIPELEVSPLEGLDLFRAPTRRRTSGAPKVKAPTPRPLGQQLLDDPVFGQVKKGPGKQGRSSSPPSRPVGSQEQTEMLADARKPPGSEATEQLQAKAPAPKKPATGKREEFVPRVGTGRHGEDPARSLEATMQVDRGKQAIAEAAAPAPVDVPSASAESTPNPFSAEGNTLGGDVSLPPEPPMSAEKPEKKTRKRRKTRSKKVPLSAEGAAERPRVGTGRWAEEGAEDLDRVEPTAAAAPSPAVPSTPEAPSAVETLKGAKRGGRGREESTQAEQRPASLHDDGAMPAPEPPRSVVRAGTGRPERDDDHEVTEAVPLSEIESSVHPVANVDDIGDIPSLDTGDVPRDDAGEMVLSQESGQFSEEDLPFEYDIAGEADDFETGAALTRPVEAGDILDAVPDEFGLDDVDPTHAGGDNPLTHPTSAQGQVTMVSNIDELLLSSILGEQPHRGKGTGLQNVYEDLIDRFRQAPDRRGRERVARRLIDDSRADDVEIRALAVWAMVKLEERGFRRALAKAANDDNPEISKLAMAGLERVGGGS
jgi:hypothetical protein